MQHNNTMVVQLTVDQLQEIISNAVILGLKQHQKSVMIDDETESDILLTRQEVSALLKVSYPTLWAWNNSGILRAQKMGKKVFYNKDDVMRQLR
ncbi:helix-turn-helix domain-containing protein [Flavobacterium hydrophilum]|uniref:DNA-binding protein n=1 Tax=Flavobacterium hydrophilum TaxID=2211445 RepID=A0A2V4C340_9FLAO|nr:helix-turn-helix domain-containing protein [Flavobacterium hydrophilum]PXY45232.1 DNA-binding protein [Flavobacterium hydrophilum]